MKVKLSFLPFLSRAQFSVDLHFSISQSVREIRLELFDRDDGGVSQGMGYVAIQAEQLASRRRIQGTFPLRAHDVNNFFLLLFL
jgi:hypothetical protein